MVWNSNQAAQARQKAHLTNAAATKPPKTGPTQYTQW